MHRFQCALLASVALIGFASIASAADMAVKARPMAPAPAALTWTGCYIGGNAGSGWGHSDYTDADPNNGPVGLSFDGHTASGIVGGGQIGCDYQVSNWVFGIQGLFDGANIKGSHPDPVNSFSITWTSKVSWLATTTGRIGYTVTPAALLYAKGGAAWVRMHDDRSTGTGFAQTEPDRTLSGWTIGGGLEYRLAPNWAVFGEYNYIGLGTKTETFVRSTDGATLLVAVKRDVQTVLLGVNYRFGGP